MQKKRYLQSIIIILCSTAVLLYGCQKITMGFLSDRIFYQVDPFDVPQGVTAVSESLVTDGSTAPLHVALLALKDSNGKNVDTAFTNPKPIITFSGNITYNDSTEESIRSKLKDSLVSPFNIASIGGRLQFTAATAFVAAGSYTMDISVTNVRASRVIQNACQINLVPSDFIIDQITPYTYLLDTATQGRVYSTPNITATRNIEGPPVITIKWVDADGKIFNPKKGEVLTRSGLASFQNWDPYYDVVLTDTSFVFKYPDHVPVFPVFTTAKVGLTGTEQNYASYYRIPAKYLTEPGQEARTGFGIKFPNALGSYDVMIQVVSAHKK